MQELVTSNLLQLHFRIRLYVQKGHDPTACRRFLRKNRWRHLFMCLRRPSATCVCQPLFLRVFVPLMLGMETPVLLLHQRSWQYMVRISVPDAELTYLLSTHRLQWSTLLLFRWFHGCSHDRPQNLFPPQTCSRLAALPPCAFRSHVGKPFVETSTIALTFHLTVEPFLSSGDCIN